MPKTPTGLIKISNVRELRELLFSKDIHNIFTELCTNRMSIHLSNDASPILQEDLAC